MTIARWAGESLRTDGCDDAAHGRPWACVPKLGSVVGLGLRRKLTSSEIITDFRDQGSALSQAHRVALCQLKRRSPE